MAREAMPAVGALRGENVGVLHRQRHGKPLAHIGEGKPRQLDGVDGRKRRLLVVGERQHEHGRGGERRHPEPVVLAAGHEILEEPARGGRFRFLAAPVGAWPAKVSFMLAGAVEQQHDIGALAEALDALAEAIDTGKAEDEAGDGDRPEKPKPEIDGERSVSVSAARRARDSPRSFCAAKMSGSTASGSSRSR